MRAPVRLMLSVLCVSVFPVVTVQAEVNPRNAPSAISAQTQGENVVEGTVVSMTDQTLVVKSDDNQFHLFTHGAGIVSQGAVTPGARVRVTGSAPDAVGTRVAEKADLVQLIEGTVVSTSPDTLVVKTDDNNFRMFTYSPGTVPQDTVKPDVRVRVNAVAPNAQAARVAESVTVIQPGQANVAGTETHAAATEAHVAAPAAPSAAAPSAPATTPSAATHAPSAVPEAPSATMQASG